MTMATVTASRNAVTNATTLMTALTDQRPGLASALNTAITAYEEAYTGGIQSPLSSVISTFREYANSWQANLTALYNITRQALEQAKTEFQTAESLAQDQYLSSTTMGSLSEESMTEEIAAYYAQMEAMQKIQIGSPEIPELPPMTTNLSMGDLMRILSQVQLVTWDLVRSIQVNMISTPYDCKWLLPALRCTLQKWHNITPGHSKSTLMILTTTRMSNPIISTNIPALVRSMNLGIT
jgi:hypothetical protein